MERFWGLISRIGETVELEHPGDSDDPDTHRRAVERRLERGREWERIIKRESR